MLLQVQCYGSYMHLDINYYYIQVGWVTIPCAILDNISSKYKAVRGEMVEMDSLGQLVGRDKKEKRDQP